MDTGHTQQASTGAPDSEVNGDHWVWAYLGTMHSYRASECGALWSIFGHFWAANAVLLVALFATGHAPNYPWGVLICGVGSLISFVWWLLQTRAFYHIDRTQDIIKSAEKIAGLRSGLSLYADGASDPRGGRWYALRRNPLAWGVDPPMGARRSMQACAMLVALAWVLGALGFLSYGPNRAEAANADALTAASPD